MTKLAIFGVLCVVSSAACDIKHFGDCDDDWEEADDFGTPPRPDRGGSGGSGNASNGTGGTGAESTGGSSSGGSSSGGSSSSGAAGTGAVEPPPTPCSQESDCEPGFNCDYERSECVPADEETCLELASEGECDARNDCVTVYAGTDCSCGPECTCVGGEPGCVCQSFEFFQCEDVVE